MRIELSEVKNQTNNLDKIVKPLLEWYDTHARKLPWRENPDPYAVWISEIMLQQTRVEAVKPYFDRWMKALPTLSALATASEEAVMKLWEGLGYYSRARNIHKTAKIVEETYNGFLPSSFEALLKLPGIGEYSAGSIGSIAFQLPVPCVDGNVLRVITRVTAEDADISETSTKRFVTRWIQAIIPSDRPGDFNQSLMELGATICLPNGQPKCEQCPISFCCEAFHLNKTTEFPVKKPKPQRKIEKRTVLLLLRGSSCAVRKRGPDGLLAGLWEYPNYEGELKEHEVVALLKNEGLSPISLTKLKKSKHIFTHLEWHMTGYLITLSEENQRNLIQESHQGVVNSGLRSDESVLEDRTTYVVDNETANSSDIKWVGRDFLTDSAAIPTAFKNYHKALMEILK